MFKFKLKSLLTLRENEEKAKKRELGTLTIHYQSLVDALNKTLVEIDSANEGLKKSMAGQVIISDIQVYNSHLSNLKKKKKQTQEEMKSIEKKIELKKEELKESVKNRKILENLKELKKEEYDEEEKHQEQKSIDEIVSYKYTQKGQVKDNAE